MASRFGCSALSHGAATGFNNSTAATRVNSSSSGSNGGQRVQFGPGQDVGWLSEDITSGRYVASNLRGPVTGGGVPSLSHSKFGTMESGGLCVVK